MYLRFVVHVLCVPYCLVALDALIFWAWTLINESTVPAVLLVLPFFAYCFIPSVFGLAYFIACQAVIIVAWRTAPAHSHMRGWLIAYEIVLLLFAGYLIWWFATGQKVKPIGGYL